MGSQRDTRNTDTPTASHPHRHRQPQPTHRRHHLRHTPHANTVNTTASLLHTQLQRIWQAHTGIVSTLHATWHLPSSSARKHVVVSLGTSARLGSPSCVDESVRVGVVAAPASCIRVHTRQPMHQRRRSHVAGYTALLLLHRDMHTAHGAMSACSRHAATTPARQRTTHRHNH